MNMTPILFAFRDITKVKLIDQSLQKSEARYRGLLDNLECRCSCSRYFRNYE
jgi:hypothetical protein